MTMFTVAVTIIRGTIQHGRIATDFTQSQNIGWVYFWISVEFVTGRFSWHTLYASLAVSLTLSLFTAYLISCLVSFRMLFVHNEKSSSARAQELAHNQFSPPRPSAGSKPSRKKLFDSLLDTFHSWEGTTRNSHDDFFLNGTLPSGRMSVDFMHYQPGGPQYQPGGRVTSGAWPLHGSASSGRPESTKTLTAQESEVTEVPRSESVKSLEKDSSFERPRVLLPHQQ